MLEIAIILGFVIILGLGFYAGKLLFQLKEQYAKQSKMRSERIENIIVSVHTIAMAMAQQQCDISEGVIRLTNLLDALPILPAPDFRKHYPAIYSLHDEISQFATHEKRAALTKKERREEDKAREAIEAQYESKIMDEVARLQKYSPQL